MPLPVNPYAKVPREALALVQSAKLRLRLNQKEFGTKLGSSKRTVSRWGSGSMPTFGHLIKLARLVDPVDRALAASLAAVAGETLESLGIVAPAPPPPRPPPPLPGRLIVHAVICAAADALQATPAAARPAVLAAFRMAKELGMSVEDVERALATTGGGS